MAWWRRFRAFLPAGILRRAQHERDLDDEIRFDLAEEARLRSERGESPESARTAAGRDFGRVARIKEETREVWGWSFLDRLLQDLQFALRTLSKSPGFTLTAVVTLALGIGLCSFLFSSMNGLVLRRLPGASEPERLAALELPVPYPYFERYRDGGEVASAVAAFIAPVPFGVAVGRGTEARPERIMGHLVSPEYFSTLGVEPLLGRLFEPASERRGAAPTVVVSERFWRTRLNADPNAAGRTLRINGHQASIVGVARPEFVGVFPAPAADIFLPVTADPAIAPELAGDLLETTASSRFRVVLRLAPGVSMAAAEAAVDVQTRGFEQQEGKRDPKREKQGRLVRLVSANGIFPVPREQRAITILFFGLLMALILTFTCANLAGLILARSKARSREIAIRLSLGAGRWRLIRQLLTESVLLATVGGIAGLAAAYGLLELLMRSVAVSSAFPSAIMLTPDLRVASLTCLVSLLAGAGFGLLPALAATRPDLITGLKDSATAAAGRYRRFGLRNLFMVYQMGAAMALVLIAGFMLSGLQRAANQDPGFDPDGLYLLSIDPVRDGISPDKSAEVLMDLLERFAQLPGVHTVTLADRTPFGAGLGPTDSVSAAGDDGRESVHRVVLQTIGPDFFATLGVAVLRGREFTNRELLSDPARGDMLPAVINQSAARAMFGDADPLGRLISHEDQVFQVAAVVRNDRPAPFRNTASATVSVPLTMQHLRRGSVQGFSVMLGARESFDFTGLRNALDAIDSRLTTFNQQTMRQNLARFEQGVSIASSIYAVVGVFALILAGVGLAGVTAQAVVRRRKEIGIRMALGARRPQVLRLVMKEGTAMVWVGSVLGFAAGFALTRVIASISAQAAEGIALSASDPRRILVAQLLLVAVAAIACYLPARRAASIEPLATLREE